jgi:hypothetical protein
VSILLAVWTFISSPIGRWIAGISIALVLGFSQGWAIKARLDRSATLQTVIAKQRIDLKAAQDVADTANTAIAEMAKTDNANQETIRDLQTALSKKPQAAGCTLDDPTARGLRRLR